MDQQASAKGLVVPDGDGQILIFPDGFFDVGEEVEFRREGDLVIIRRSASSTSGTQSPVEEPNGPHAEVLDQRSSLEARGSVVRPSRPAPRAPQDEERWVKARGEAQEE